ncbi:unnamed protein product [Candidula unifasciata]|uniref:Complex 1 LYR protein domain-containing protein n=1 Tax=Candidula unifasciata TaxID=100452 RepID=A0A8S4A6V6_9EUPU|nr:unnamed protein product [Candidula unifasciata]
MSGIYRYQVLSLYKQILRLAKSWTASSGQLRDTEQERTYIIAEAQVLFRKNMHETNEERIKEYIREAETRIGLAKHYGNPYPRMMNFPQNVLSPKGHAKLKKDKQILDQATPIYLKSYEDETHGVR